MELDDKKFKKPASKKNPKGTLAKGKKKKAPIEESMLEDGEEFMFKEEVEEPEDWIYMVGEKKLGLEAVEGNVDVDGKTRMDSSEVNTAQFYKKYNIENRSMWKWSTDFKSKGYDEYPLTWSGKCLHCSRRFTSIPLFAPDKGFDTKQNCWILEIFAHCGPSCAKGRWIESSETNKLAKIGDLSRFVRDFFCEDLVTINYIPLCAVIDINPVSGWLTWEEYDQKCIFFDGTVKKNPFRFVDTFMEILSNEEKEKRRKQRYEEMANMKATEEQQDNYKKELERVARDRSKNQPSVKDTIIGRQLGMIAKGNKKS